MISQTAEYALRAIVFLAEPHGAAQTNQQIAAATKVPAGYLSKVLQGLSRAGLVVSQRGLGGGFALARAPEEMTILEIVEAVDPLPRIRSCPLKIKEHETTLCALHRRLDEATAQVEKTFRDTTVADLLVRPRGARSMFDASAPSRKARAKRS
jgi:Rrf2 family transcriptional regulator, nitric oxide-sensitive transcriptional repressor